jgi:hypothetical protein
MAHRGRHNGDLTLVMALAAGLTNKQAAKEAGVSERTVVRRLGDPAFRKQVADARATTVEQAAARLTAASLMAVKTLLELLGAESESVRLSAAKGILEIGTKMREAGELETKVKDLADRLAQLEESRGPRVVTRPA